MVGKCPLHLVDLDDNERDISANYPRQIAFQPGGQHLAILDVDPAGTAYRFRIVNLNLPGAFVIWGDTLDSTLAPRFDWSNDGARLVIATGIDADGAIRLHQLSGIPQFIAPIGIGTPIVLPNVTSSYLGSLPMESSNVDLMDVTYDNVHQLGILLATSDGIYALDADNTFSQLLDASLLQASFSELDVPAAALNIAGNNQGQANLALLTDIGLKSFNCVGDLDPMSL